MVREEIIKQTFLAGRNARKYGVKITENPYSGAIFVSRNNLETLISYWTRGWNSGKRYKKTKNYENNSKSRTKTT